MPFVTGLDLVCFLLASILGSTWPWKALYQATDSCVQRSSAGKQRFFPPIIQEHRGDLVLWVHFSILCVECGLFVYTGNMFEFHLHHLDLWPF